MSFDFPFVRLMRRFRQTGNGRGGGGGGGMAMFKERVILPGEKWLYSQFSGPKPRP
jgi:hypothetical protein